MHFIKKWFKNWKTCDSPSKVGLKKLGSVRFGSYSRPCSPKSKSHLLGPVDHPIWCGHHHIKSLGNPRNNLSPLLTQMMPGIKVSDHASQIPGNEVKSFKLTTMPKSKTVRKTRFKDTKVMFFIFNSHSTSNQRTICFFVLILLGMVAFCSK